METKTESLGCCSRKNLQKKKNPNNGEEEKEKAKGICLYPKNSKNFCSVQLPSVFLSHVNLFGIFFDFLFIFSLCFIWL